VSEQVVITAHEASAKFERTQLEHKALIEKYVMNDSLSLDQFRDELSCLHETESQEKFKNKK
jgi:hypothetical protein